MIMNSYATFHDLWLGIHTWIYVYEYREIIPEIMCTKVPDGLQEVFERAKQDQDLARPKASGHKWCRSLHTDGQRWERKPA